MPRTRRDRFHEWMTQPVDAVFDDGALYKHGNLGQGIYIDPKRDFVGVYFSTNGYIPRYGEDKMPGYLRRAAKYLAGQ